jgi:hypothetical protein
MATNELTPGLIESLADEETDLKRFAKKRFGVPQVDCKVVLDTSVLDKPVTRGRKSAMTKAFLEQQGKALEEFAKIPFGSRLVPGEFEWDTSLLDKPLDLEAMKDK